MRRPLNIFQNVEKDLRNGRLSQFRHSQKSFDQYLLYIWSKPF